jgi:hypothetical protein
MQSFKTWVVWTVLNRIMISEAVVEDDGVVQGNVVSIGLAASTDVQTKLAGTSRILRWRVRVDVHIDHCRLLALYAH